MGEIFGCPARRLVGLPIAGFIAGENIPAAPKAKFTPIRAGTGPWMRVIR